MLLRPLTVIWLICALHDAPSKDLSSYSHSNGVDISARGTHAASLVV